MTKIGLIRHGITEWNVLGKAQGISNIPLNEEGIQQAIKLGDRLSSEEWDLIISSDLSRAKKTAIIIGSKMNLSVDYLDKRIREINCGQIEGTTEEERVIRWGRNWRDLDLGMERFELVAKRGIEFIEDIANLHKGKRVLVVSHGALIGLTLQHLIPERFPTTYIENTSITVLQNIEDVWDCKLYNCTHHLQ
ncbi:histidine phosphatase family protein [Sporosarcina luteola]|uniref:histidine phosphatase family protein n=1 Tax=Sporosarcina luteola TaxID=582850 RepID=UPI0020416144|nr:histidine phosphatase family protein [Sporosarcina luteola]MCM3710690.1 histidine phosphatase family protein [Sporosarcina luteola]